MIGVKRPREEKSYTPAEEQKFPVTPPPIVRQNAVRYLP